MLVSFEMQLLLGLKSIILCSDFINFLNCGQHHCTMIMRYDHVANFEISRYVDLVPSFLVACWGLDTK